MKPLILNVLKSKYFTIPAIVIVIIIAGIMFYFSGLSSKVIFPDATTYNYETYTDAVNGADSRILGFTNSDSTLKLIFRLDMEYLSPYVGLSVFPEKNTFIDASPYNQLSIAIKGNNIERVGISLFNPPVIKENKASDEALYHSYLNITDQTRTYHLPLKQFKHPDWWEDLHHISAEQQSKADMSKILNINIGSAYTPSKTDNKSFEIYSLAFTRNNKVLFYQLAALGVLSLLALLLVNYLVVNQRNLTSPFTVYYQALATEASESPDEKCFTYINSHFSNNELSLELVSNETALPQRHITNAIHKKYNCNFKSYINRIRINESKRLLETTNLNIGEIAFKVGFNNQSHFNRVFKSELQMSPGAFREKQRQ